MKELYVGLMYLEKRMTKFVEKECGWCCINVELMGTMLIAETREHLQYIVN